MTPPTRGADCTRRNARQAVIHFRATGQDECADLLEQLLAAAKPVSARRARREAMFEPPVVDFLESLDRRREAARRLPPCCPFSEHERHGLGCYDPIAAAG